MLGHDCKNLVRVGKYLLLFKSYFRYIRNLDDVVNFELSKAIVIDHSGAPQAKSDVTVVEWNVRLLAVGQCFYYLLFYFFVLARRFYARNGFIRWSSPYLG